MSVTHTRAHAHIYIRVYTRIDRNSGWMDGWTDDCPCVYSDIAGAEEGLAPPKPHFGKSYRTINSPFESANAPVLRGSASDEDPAPSRR